LLCSYKIFFLWTLHIDQITWVFEGRHNTIIELMKLFCIHLIQSICDSSSIILPKDTFAINSTTTWMKIDKWLVLYWQMIKHILARQTNLETLLSGKGSEVFIYKGEGWPSRRKCQYQSETSLSNYVHVPRTVSMYFLTVKLNDIFTFRLIEGNAFSCVNYAF
jgi:hypothetical protein